MTDEEYFATFDRIDALFPDPDRGYGDDMRRVLSLVTRHGLHSCYADSVVRVFSELLDRMENDAKEQAELDAYVTAMEAEANA